MPLEFQWDSSKAALNRKKHGIGFEEACSVFADPLAAIFGDKEHSTEETREIVIGYSILGRLLLVCFTEREETTIRIYKTRAT